MSTWRTFGVAFAVVATMTTPAAAQFSDSYKFLKAVKDKDGATATKVLNTPGNTVVNVRDGDSGETALHIVVRRGDLAWLGFLLQNGANPNLTDREGATPLALAATTGFNEGLTVLVAVRAQVDVPNRLGETPLIKAVQARNEAAAKALLEAGADPDRTDNTGNSARAYALADKRGGPVARLLRAAPARKAAPVQGPRL